MFALLGRQTLDFELPQGVLCQLLTVMASPEQTEVGPVPQWPLTLGGALTPIQLPYASSSHQCQEAQDVLLPPSVRLPA